MRRLHFYATYAEYFNRTTRPFKAWTKRWAPKDADIHIDVPEDQVIEWNEDGSVELCGDDEV